MAGSVTSCLPASKPDTRANVPAGAPTEASASMTICAVRADSSGWPGCALTTTGEPAARAAAVSPPATEKANGKLLAAYTATGPIETRSRRRSGFGPSTQSGSAVSMVASAQLPSASRSEQPQLVGGARQLTVEAAVGQGATPRPRARPARSSRRPSRRRSRRARRSAGGGVRVAERAGRTGRGLGGGGDLRRGAVLKHECLSWSCVRCRRAASRRAPCRRRPGWSGCRPRRPRWRPRRRRSG